MKPDLKEQMAALESRIRKLEDMAAQKSENQLSYPLDNASRQIVQIGTVLISGGRITAGAPFTNNGYIPCSFNGTVYKLMTTA